MEGLAKWLVAVLAGPVGRHLAVVGLTALVGLLEREGVIEPELAAALREPLATGQ